MGGETEMGGGSDTKGRTGTRMRRKQRPNDWGRESSERGDTAKERKDVPQWRAPIGPIHPRRQSGFDAVLDLQSHHVGLRRSLHRG